MVIQTPDVEKGAGSIPHMHLVKLERLHHAIAVHAQCHSEDALTMFPT